MIKAVQSARVASFGDCDPVGLVFYPRYFAWFDQAFHDWLRPHGGHAVLAAQLGAIGIGLLEASARFHAPTRDGDALSIALSVERWGAKTLHLAYEVRNDEHLVATGRETRSLFIAGEHGMFAGGIDGLRRILDPDGD